MSEAMPAVRVAALTLLAMLAFAANSLLCRLALKDTGIDAASFTAIRLCSGALTLWLIVTLRQRAPAAVSASGNWISAAALFAYAGAFSYAYVSLSAATGALLLFGAVQATMLGYALCRGERLRALQLAGLVLAMAGLCGLLLPGLEAPLPGAALLMIAAGTAWGVYSLRAKGSGSDPTAATAGNFMRALPFAVALALLAWPLLQWDVAGAIHALLSGALASGVGYAIWYAVLPSLRASSAATVQLSVPLLSAAGGVVLLDEALSLRLLVAGAATVGGIALVLRPAGTRH